MLITPEQETALLLLLSGVQITHDSPLLGAVVELRDDLRQRCMLRSQINELAREATR